MALFDVPGWNMPKEIKQSGDTKSRKRKRGAPDEASSKLQAAGVNVEKLMEKLAEVKDAPKKDRKKPEDERGRGKKKVTKSLHAEASPAKSHGPSSREPTEDRSNRRAKSKKFNEASSSSHGQVQSVEAVSLGQTTSQNMERSKIKINKAEATKPDGASMNRQPHLSSDGSNAKLTSLQSKMKQSLDGARFRWINETLYKADSHEAERLMQEDPKVFEEYHTGFRHQVTSWPINPVDHFIKTLSSYPESYVIVDLGCGDAALAQNLVPKGYTVLSFDLISANAFVVAADICRRLPLPGSESAEEGQIVDVVVCCLSLMNTNWLNCIREARRILKRGGELKIAEVASRFTNIDKFTSVICSVGFRLVSKDEYNTHFTLFDFKKAEGSMGLGDKVWQKALARADVLQPCEYKRR